MSPSRRGTRPVLKSTTETRSVLDQQPIDGPGDHPPVGQGRGERRFAERARAEQGREARIGQDVADAARRCPRARRRRLRRNAPASATRCRARSIGVNRRAGARATGGSATRAGRRRASPRSAAARVSSSVRDRRGRERARRARFGRGGPERPGRDAGRRQHRLRASAAAAANAPRAVNQRHVPPRSMRCAERVIARSTTQCQLFAGRGSRPSFLAWPDAADDQPVRGAGQRDIEQAPMLFEIARFLVARSLSSKGGGARPCVGRSRGALPAPRSRNRTSARSARSSPGRRWRRRGSRPALRAPWRHGRSSPGPRWPGGRDRAGHRPSPRENQARKRSSEAISLRSNSSALFISSSIGSRAAMPSRRIELAPALASAPRGSSRGSATAW